MDFEEASGRAYELGWWDGIGSQLGEFEGSTWRKILRLNLTVGSVQRRRRIPVQGIDDEEKIALWNRTALAFVQGGGRLNLSHISTSAHDADSTTERVL